MSKPKNNINLSLNKEYKSWLKNLKQKVLATQLKAAVQVNSTLLNFYWELGEDIVRRQVEANWGDGFLKQLNKDLSSEFPDIKGFSLSNIKYIRQWHLFYRDEVEKSQQLVGQLTSIPWGHNLKIISKCQTTAEALYYVGKTIEHGWSRNVLTHQIESGLWQRKGQAPNNFNATLPAVQSDLAQQTLKDPYMFDFLAFTDNYTERELEQGLIKHITQFLLELGSGFAYMGKQFHIQVGPQDFYIDLLFYHAHLHCYVVIELKAGDFRPEHAGKLNFYIKAVDELVRREGDAPTIGILLCKNKDKLVAEYALSDIQKPIGVSEYQLSQSLPENLQSQLPSIEEIEQGLGGEL
ncbi:YhcG family protein [Endozoicomonas sp. SESOKO3]|uniref:PDDEXK nuclease domain-containing protein n=1 Tax=Endozoicomonas sp. SESOKO3 TaxID=2828744 RepID=UPI002147BFE9|nr:PDDEXK nuclease domain-containing protein [Endozoicomonas sp. SESOKO3]